MSDNPGVETFEPEKVDVNLARLDDEERAARLLESYRESGDVQAIEELLGLHERLLKHVVRRHADSSGESYEDLLQVGYVGLVKAVQGYDPSAGAKFSSYAYAMIDGEIRHHRRDAGIVKQPRWARSLYSSISEATSRLEERLGRTPSVEEISEEANLSPEGVREVTRIFRDTNPASLEEEPDLSGIRSLRHESFALPVEDRIVLDEALESLSELQRKVVYLFFYKDLTQTEIGKSLGMSQRKVSRVIASATGALRVFLGVGR